MVLVLESLKAQETAHQDLETWLRLAPDQDVQSRRPLFFPSWEILPHEDRLPHADVISERLETLLGLMQPTSPAPMVVASVEALLQRTFSQATLRAQTRRIERGDRLNPLDLIEWLEDLGYESEAKVSQKGEISMRGGIVDLYPPTSPWPVRVEFFGDEIESIRYFDPLTQVSREQIKAFTAPPAGELGLMKRMRQQEVADSRQDAKTPSGEGTNGANGALAKQGPHSHAEPVTDASEGRARLLSSRSELEPSSLENGSSESSPSQRHERTTSPASEAPSQPSASPFSCLLDYLPPNALLLLCEPELLEARAADYSREIPENDPFFVSWAELRQEALARGFSTLVLSEAEGFGASHEPGEQPGAPVLLGSAGAFDDPHTAPASPAPDLESPSLEAFRPLPEKPPEPQVAEEQRKEFFHQIHRWLRQGSAVHVFCNNDGERQRFIEIWQEYNLPLDSSESAEEYESSARHGRSSKPLSPNPSPSPPAPIATPTLEVAPGLFARIGQLSRGFLFDAGHIVVITDSEIFGRYRFQRPRRLRTPHALATRSALDIDFSDLEEGDFVVHLQHGIGRYEGTAFLPVGLGRKGVEPSRDAESAGADASGQECLVIEYAPSDPAQPPPKLYVPLTEAHLVSKYVGVGKARPPLNTLGGTRWLKAKAQAERAVRDVAAELLAIQAARESLPGHAFGADTAWQREFESAFIYEETPDQVRSIRETKVDMERPKPMDRLICGDVGFGKTEVAIRAAFKAVLGGKQVALLVPTTVLAQQHYNTFRERMADYPVKIELLSRFRTRREQTKVIQEVAAGTVDIVIGTHRLIQSDVEFKDLGLVVIDEEQRFGVLHKEKFKCLRHLVDVLTLSATPIPRTLYLALSGARDMSTLQTPPHDRLPVQTVVTEYDERLIRDAIQRELNRGGQVFFLHNRVATIHEMARKLGTLVPQAKIVVGHGQMESDDLEEVMTAFINGQADVLLSTTIIESGLDIPNANTIIIDRADRFGLSDLYQLRGRVGRYKHQAYAYLLLPRHARLLTDVRKRMSAIKQYSTLGSGFKIAMRDLEIRGAGNLLGAEQSGHITAVGFDLYCQLLKQSVASSKGEKVKPRIEVQVRLDFLSLNATDRPEPAPKEPAVPWRDDLGTHGEVDESDPAATRDMHPVARSAKTKSAKPTEPGPAAAYIPYRYITDTRQRIEVYRKLALATQKSTLEELSKEMRDRYGPLPQQVELLLAVADLKILAAEKMITAIEVKEQKLMLTRQGDYIMVGSKFPRLTKNTATARIKEIRKLLLVL